MIHLLVRARQAEVVVAEEAREPVEALVLDVAALGRALWRRALEPAASPVLGPQLEHLVAGGAPEVVVHGRHRLEGVRALVRALLPVLQLLQVGLHLPARAERALLIFCKGRASDNVISALIVLYTRTCRSAAHEVKSGQRGQYDGRQEEDCRLHHGGLVHEEDADQRKNCMEVRIFYCLTTYIYILAVLT